MYTGQIPAASNREDYNDFIAQVIDDDTGEGVDLTAATIVAAVYDADGCQVITPTITLAESDTFQLFIPLATMATLCAGTYRVGITIENAGITKSFVVGSLPVLEGNVPR